METLSNKRWEGFDSNDWNYTEKNVKKFIQNIISNWGAISLNDFKERAGDKLT